MSVHPPGGGDSVVVQPLRDSRETTWPDWLAAGDYLLEMPLGKPASRVLQKIISPGFLSHRLRKRTQPEVQSEKAWQASFMCPRHESSTGYPFYGMPMGDPTAEYKAALVRYSRQSHDFLNAHYRAARRDDRLSRWLGGSAAIFAAVLGTGILRLSNKTSATAGEPPPRRRRGPGATGPGAHASRPS